MPQVTLKQLAGAYAVVRLDPGAPVPQWADGPGFVSISRSDEELSIVCLEARVPPTVQHAGGWAAFKLQGPFAFNETGILLSVIAPLSPAGISIFAVSTFDTDYLLVKEADAQKTIVCLREAGHTIL